MGDKNYKSQLDDIEISEAENYRGDKIQVFNHQVLVMEVMRKLNEAGSHELRTGYTNQKVDRSGNTTTQYIEDTRKKFIECVKSAIAIMRCDFDKEAEDFVEQCFEELEAKRKVLLEAQWTWYQSLAPLPKQEFSGKIQRYFFAIDFGWYMEYVETEVACYRAISEELSNLTARKDFYVGDTYGT